MFFIRTQRSGVHFGGHRKWPAAGQASPFLRKRAVANTYCPQADMTTVGGSAAQKAHH